MEAPKLVESDEKEYSISQMYSMKKILEEVKKCVIRCSNCHRKYHGGLQEVVDIVDGAVGKW